jgi:hypothetical protein
MHSLLRACANRPKRFICSVRGWGADLAEFPELFISDHQSLVRALRAVQIHLQISNSTLEEISGLAAGHVDKLLGPSQAKRIGPTVLGLLLGGLGVRLRVDVDIEAAKKMAGRWEKKHAEQEREHTRLSKQLLELARPIVLGQVARKGWQTRQRQARRQNGHAHNGLATRGKRRRPRASKRSEAHCPDLVP